MRNRSHARPGRREAFNVSVGWVERSETHRQPRQACRPSGRCDGFRCAQLILQLIDCSISRRRVTRIHRQKEGVVARATLDGKEVFGVNSRSKAYTSADRVAAERLRDSLRRKYPEIPSGKNVGRAPWNALFHAETTALLRAARENGGTLAGKALTVYSVEKEVCLNCKSILPYVGLELGNPTVTFIESDGSMMTMRDGEWTK